MKLAPKSLCILASAAALLAGCTKKPVRPDPSATSLGPSGAPPAALTPTDVNVADQGSALEQRAGVIETADQIRGLLDPIHFAYDRDAIADGERPKLQAVKDYLDKNPQYRMLVEGHCDWRGTAEYNLSLGDRRANAAKKYLITLGVPADKLETLSKGSEEAVKNADDAARANDRRDDFVVLKK